MVKYFNSIRLLGLAILFFILVQSSARRRSKKFGSVTSKLGSLRNRLGEKLSFEMNSKLDAKFDLEAGYQAVSEVEEFKDLKCAQRIKESYDYVRDDRQQEHKPFKSFDVHIDECHKKLLKAMVVYVCAAIDPLGKIIRKEKRAIFGQGIMDLYNPIWSVPYHNSVHGADLIEKVIFFLEYTVNPEKSPKEKLRMRTYLGLTPVEYLATIIGGAGHDTGHSGDTNAYARSMKTFVGREYNGILELYSCDLMMGLILGRSLAQSEQYKKFFFADIFEAPLEYTHTDNENPVEAAIREKAMWGKQKLKDSYQEGGFLGDVILKSPEVVERFLGIIRQVIYSTIMNPFDNRFKHQWAKAGITKETFPFPKTAKSLFDWKLFAEKFKPALLKPVDNYYESPFGKPAEGKTFLNVEEVYKDESGEKKDELSDFNIGDQDHNLVAIKGMENLAGQPIEVQAKWYILGELSHLSDIGNGFYGVKNMRPWYEKLMSEWAILDCYERSKGNKNGYFLFNGNQYFFHIHIVFPTVKEFDTLFPGWGFEEIVNTRMYGLDSEYLDKKHIKPYFNLIKEIYELEKQTPDSCPTIFHEYRDEDYNLYSGHQVVGSYMKKVVDTVLDNHGGGEEKRKRFKAHRRLLKKKIQ